MRVGAAPIERFGRDFDDAGLPPLALGGAHQRRNAALARRALALVGVGERAIAEGFARVRWPGRLEQLSRDGAGRRRAQRRGRARAGGGAVRRGR